MRGLGGETAFLWGPRQTGKSTLLGELFPHAPRYDLLLSTEYERLCRRSSIMREELLAGPVPRGPVIIDEIQKIPTLLDEVQWLIVNKGLSFVLCGSSARKLKRAGGNLLGGRALRYELFPLVSQEIPNFNLLRAINHGLLPRHYLAQDPKERIRSYVGDYLKEEIAAEGLTRNVPAFARFLESAAFSNGETINFHNVAAECGVSGHTVKEYFQILVDTLLARFVPIYQKRPKRRIIQLPKFYFFDVGLANHLLKRGQILPRSESFGKTFEHFIFQEIVAHSHYSKLEYPVSTWRTASQLEVDFVLGEAEVAVEVKGTEQAHPAHWKNLKAFQEEYKVRHAILVTLDSRPRKTEGIDILPWKIFLDHLWGGNFIS